MSYMVAYALGLYFSQLISTDIMKGQSFFTLHFDKSYCPGEETDGPSSTLLV